MSQRHAGFFMYCCFDTHCHLADPVFTQAVLDEFFASLSNSEQSFYFLAVSTSLQDSHLTHRLSQRYDRVLASAGIHPWFVSSDFEWQLAAMEDFVVQHAASLAALGEIGLDAMPGRPSQAWQELVFEHQLRLAEAYSLPVSIHCLKAYNPMLKFLRAYNVTGVMHGFSGGAQMARAFIEAGFLIGVNSVLLNQNARRYHAMVQAVGLEHLVLESDAPFSQNFSTSQPFASLALLSKKVSELLGVTQDEVLDKTCQNAKAIFLKE